MEVLKRETPLKGVVHIETNDEIRLSRHGRFQLERFHSLCGVRHTLVTFKDNEEDWHKYGKYIFLTGHVLWFDEIDDFVQYFDKADSEEVNCPMCLDHPDVPILQLESIKL